jgi:general nucleoside transport system permease protein
VQFVQMIPYVLTLVALAGFIGRSRPPRALGLPLAPRGLGRRLP